MPSAAILTLLAANLRAQPGRLLAASVALSLAGAVLLTALVGRRVVGDQAPLTAESLLGEAEVHLAATDSIHPFVDERLLQALRADPRVARISTAHTVRAVEMPGTERGALDAERFYSHEGNGMGGWISGRRDAFLSWDDEPRGALLEGRWPSRESNDPVEIAVPRVWRLQLGDWLRLESDTGVHRAQVVGVLAGDGSLVIAPQGARLLSRQIGPAAAERLAGARLPPSDARIVLRRADDHASFLADWRPRVAPYPGRPELWDRATIRQAVQASPAAESARVAVRSAALLASAAVVCLALGVQGSAVRGRAAQWNLLRSLGAGRRTLVALVLAEALVLALLAGLGAGALARAAMTGLGGWMPVLRAPAVPDVSSTLIAGLVILFGALLGSAWPAWVASSPQAENADHHRRARRIAVRGAAVAALLLFVVVVAVQVAPAHSLTRASVAAWLGVPALAVAALCLTPAAIELTAWLFARPVGALTRTDGMLLADHVSSDAPRSAGSVIAISVGLGGFVWMLCWGASMLEAFVIDPGVPRWLVSIHPYGLDRDETERLLAQPAFEGFQPLTLFDTRLGGADNSPTLVMGLDLQRAFEGPEPLPIRFLAGDRARAMRDLASGQACLVSDWYAADAGLRVGDSISVAAPTADGPRDRTYRVAGIVELRGWRMATKQNKVRLRGEKHRALVVLDAAAARRDFPVAFVNYLLGNPPRDAQGRIPGFRDGRSDDAHQAARTAREALEAAVAAVVDLHRPVEHTPDGRPALIASQRVAQVDDLDQTRDSLRGDWGGAAVRRLGAAPLLVLGLSLLSVSATLVVSLRARARELGILRSCGLTRLGVSRLALAESLLLGLAAVPISALLGGGGAWLMLEVAAVVGYRLDFAGIRPVFTVPWAWLWPGAALTFAVCGASAGWAGWRVGRAAPAELMNESSIRG